MLYEYALIPDVFDPGAYTVAAFADKLPHYLKETLLNDSLVRDLRDGGWSAYCMAESSNLSRLGKEIIRKLANSNRLRPFAAALPEIPEAASDWCNEAIQSHQISALTGITSAHATKSRFRQLEVASIEDLTGCPWWRGRSSSLTLDRKTTDYLKCLERLSSHARHLMFIDPFLDPSQTQYREFHRLLSPLAGRTPSPLIELHRKCYVDDGGRRSVLTTKEWQAQFQPLSQQLSLIGLKATVFLWSDFHDRFLISNLVGISVPHGFDVSTRPNDLTPWTRLGKLDRARWQLEFDEAGAGLRLIGKFEIGA